MKKFLTLVIVLFYFIFNISAEATLSSVLGSGNTVENNSVESLIDKNIDTTTKFKVGESYGWVKFSFEDRELINYIDFLGFIPTDVMVYVEYSEDGYIKTFPSSFFTDIDGEFRLDLSEDHIITDEIYIRFEGSNLENLSLQEVVVNNSKVHTILEKKKLTVSEDSENTSAYTGAQLLVDGLIGTVWRTWNNELWEKSHWFVLDRIRNKHPHNKFKRGNKWQTGFATLIPEIIEEYDHLTFYVAKDATGTLDLSINSSLVNSYELIDNAGKWITVSLDSYGEINSINLDSYGIERSFSGIGEMELWGRKSALENSFQDIIPYTANIDVNDGVFNITELDYNDNYYLDLLVSEDVDVKSYIDNNLIDFYSIDNINNYYRYRYLLTDREIALGTNFFKVETESKIINAQIVKVGISNTIQVNKTPLTDRRLYSGISNDDLDIIFTEGLTSVEKIRVYYRESRPGNIYYYLEGGDRYYLSSSNVTDEYVDYDINLEINKIGLSSPNGSTEILIYGNNLEIVNPYLKLRFPKNNESMEVQGLGYKVIWGLTDSIEYDITINGKSTKNYGNYFWLNSSTPELKETGSHLLEAELTMPDGSVIRDELTVFLQSNTHEFTLDQEDKVYYTIDDTFTLSGEYNPWTSSLYVNEVLVDNGKIVDFNYDYVLENGLNIINVILMDKEGVKTREIHTRRVYKESNISNLVINSPVDGGFVNKDSISVTGYATSTGLVEVKVNGIIASLLNGRFISSSISTLQEENLVKVEATYESGSVIDKTITVFRDITPPEVLEVTPLPESWHSTDFITIEGVIVDENGYTVFVNGIKANIYGDTFTANIPIVEDKNDIDIYAKDIAGNITSYPTFNLNGDFTSPYDFTVTSEPTGWTNNSRPTISFETTDNLSGINRYEVSIDGSMFIVQESPLQLPFLNDGEINVIIRAYDNIVNYTDSNITLYIDTVPPDVPDDFRAIPGNGSVTLKWNDDDDETIYYVIKNGDLEYQVDRSTMLRTDNNIDTESEDSNIIDSLESKYNITSVIGIDYYEYTIDSLENGLSLDFEIYAVDRALNYGDLLTDSVIPGLTIQEVDYEVGTIVEYKDLFLLVKPDTLPEGIENINVTEIISAELKELSVNPIISPIYNFSVTKTDGTNLDHVSFEETFVGQISYDPDLIPEGFPEQNLGVYYFDENWSKWFKVAESGVDVVNNKIYFSTSHFTDFSVQPTVFEDISPQDLTDVEFTPFSSNVAHQPLTVSPQGGSASTSMTELSLPGKNGFDFELRRIYDTTTARGDAAGLSLNLSIGMSTILAGGKELGTELLTGGFTSIASQIENSIDKYFSNNGDYAYAIGQGWRLNLPYIRGNNGGVMIRTPSGSFYDITSMNMDASRSVSLGGYRTVVFENYEGENFTLKIHQARTDINVTGVVSSSIFSKDGKPSVKSLIPGWGLLGATLVLKDGSEYNFDALGRFIESSDPTGINTIKANYNGLLLDNITDTMGRVIKFSYTQDLGTTIIPQIDKIWIENDTLEREINYTYMNPSAVDAIISTVNPFTLPMLGKAIDINDREWNYDYDNRFLFAGEFGVKINGVALILTCMTGGAADAALALLGLETITIHASATTQWVFPMNYFEGPGLGETDLNYKTENLNYLNVTGGDYFLGLIPTAIDISIGMSQKPLVSSLKLSLNDELIKTESYSYHFSYAGNKQHYNKKTVKDNGKVKEVYEYKKLTKTRLTVFDWSDYLLSMLPSSSNPTNISSLFTESIFRKDIIPLNSKISYYDSATGVLISSVEKDYYSTSLHPKYIKTLRSVSNYSTQSFIYDDWGNVVKDEKYSISNDVESKLVTYNSYFYTNSNGTDDNANWDSSKLKGSVSLRSDVNKRYDLLRATKTINYNMHNDTNIESEGYRDYNTWGQLSLSTIKIDETWAETKFEYGIDETIVTELNEKQIFYDNIIVSAITDFLFIDVYTSTGFSVDPSKTLTGELTKTTLPNGQIIDKNYNFTDSKYYSVTETLKDVENIHTGVPSDIQTYKGYDRIMGYLNWSKDGNGNITEYSFDKIGRKTGIILPDDNDTDWDPISAEKPASRNDNPITTILYDDINLTAKETKLNGLVLIYSFDNLSRLSSINKYTDFDIDIDENEQTLYSSSKFEYDMNNNIIEYTDPKNFVTTFTYNTLNEISSKTYSDYNTSESNGGYLIEKVSKMTNAYSKLKKTIRDENGTKIVNYYDFNGNIIKTVYYGSDDNILFNTESHYDGLGNLIESKDGKDNITKYEYNSINKLIKASIPEADYYINGVESKESSYSYITYDKLGNKKTESLISGDSYESKTTYTYDGLNRVTSDSKTYKNINGDVKSSINKYVYDSNGNLVLTIDPRGNEWEKTYTARNVVKSEYDPQKNETSYIYDTSDRVKIMTDPRGNSGNYNDQDFSITYYYDKLDRLISAELPRRIDRDTLTIDNMIPTINFAYDKNNNLSSRIEPDGAYTTYSYSNKKNVLSETKYSDVEKTGVSYTTYNEYDNLGNLLKSINPDNITYRSFTYDSLNRLKLESINGGKSIERFYDHNDNVIMVRNKNNFDSFFEYDSLNRLITEKDYLLQQIDYMYDPLGNITYVKDRIGNENKSYFNSIGQLLKEVNGRNLEKKFYYDLSGNLTKCIDAKGISGVYDVDNNNLLDSITYSLTDKLDHVIEYEFDEAGVAKSILDNGILTKYNYIGDTYYPDPYDQIFDSNNAGYSRVSYNYDIMNRQTEMNYNSGEHIKYNYNSLSQLISIDDYITSISYDSNAFKDVIEFTNGVQLDYDFTNNFELESINYTHNTDQLLNFEYGYDPESNILSENDNLFGYDGKNQLTTALLIGGASQQEKSLTNYDTGSAILDVIGNQELGHISLSGENFDLDWGAKSFGLDLYYGYRVSKIVLHRDGTLGEVLTKDTISIYSSIYNRDGSFNKVEDFTVKEDDYSDDLIIEFSKPTFGRYFKITTHFNEMDIDGNAKYNSLKEYFSVKSDNPVTVYSVSGGRNEFYSLDAKGNRNSKTIMVEEFDTSYYNYYEGSDLIKTDGTFGYIYDLNGNLITKGSEYTEESNILEISQKGEYFSYLYDLKNRLISVSKLTKDGLRNTTYLYDSNNYRIRRTDYNGDVTDYIFDLDGNCIEENEGDSHSNFFFVNNRHIAKKVGDDKYFYGLNNVGSTLLLTDINGNNVWDGDITPFGDQESSTGIAGENVKYTGKSLDIETGLYYYNARWYDPNLGRFITEDPIKDGTNWYIYANNNPLIFIDPTGLEFEWANVAEGFKASWDAMKEVPNTLHEAGEISKDAFARAPGDLKEGIINSADELREAGSILASQTPGLGDLKDIQEALSGVDLIKGEELTIPERVATGIAAILPVVTAPGLKKIAKTINKAPVSTKALPAPKMIKHHVFNKFRGKSPASQKYRDFFSNHNINVDDFTIQIPETMHKKQIHKAGNNWTTKWKKWIDTNPSASTKEVYQYGGQLMDEFGVNNVPLVPYK